MNDSITFAASMIDAAHDDIMEEMDFTEESGFYFGSYRDRNTGDQILFVEHVMRTIFHGNRPNKFTSAVGDLDHFSIRCVINASEYPGASHSVSHGFEIGTISSHFVSGRIHRILSKIDAGFDRLNDKEGYCENFEDYVERVAKILGIKNFYLGFKEAKSYDDSQITPVKLNAFKHRIRETVGTHSTNISIYVM